MHDELETKDYIEAAKEAADKAHTRAHRETGYAAVMASVALSYAVIALTQTLDDRLSEINDALRWNNQV